MQDIPFDFAFDIGSINAKCKENIAAAVSECENRIEREVLRTAEEIFAAGEKLKIVLVCGRSASGKTTFTKKVCEKLCKMCREARHIALDDFFLGISALPKNPDGTYDMESIKGLDVALANECFAKLLGEGFADFPTFDFPKQRRGETWNRVELGKSGLIIIEGIHALNPLLTENLPEEGIMRVYIQPECSYYFGGEKILSPKDIRIIRRAVRDELFRGWSAEKTLIQWKSVLDGEKIYIEPYIDSAKIKVNSSMEIEPMFFKDILGKMLSEISEDSEYYSFGKGLLDKISLFCGADAKFLPKDSLLREFVG